MASPRTRSPPHASPPAEQAAALAERRKQVRPPQAGAAPRAVTLRLPAVAPERGTPPPDAARVPALETALERRPRPPGLGGRVGTALAVRVQVAVKRPARVGLEEPPEARTGP